ncbi:MAG: preprotein translocase subunit YajC [Bifidobacteriaceae bacterium]|nr:preprotein translocase subunit YajC [Bifidobacteriaceae bacterium]
MSLLDVVWLADETPTGDQTGTGGGGSILSGSMPMIILFGGMILLMFFMSRRNKKKQQDVVDFRKSLAPGQRIMTVGGMIGTITKTQGDTVTLMSPEGDQSVYVRRAIRSLVPDDEWEAMIAEYPDEPEDDEEPLEDADEVEAEADEAESADEDEDEPEADDKAEGEDDKKA